MFISPLIYFIICETGLKGNKSNQPIGISSLPENYDVYMLFHYEIVFIPCRKIPPLSL